MERPHIAGGLALVLVLVAGGVYQGCLAGSHESEAALEGVGPGPDDMPPLVVLPDAGPVAVVAPPIPGAPTMPGTNPPPPSIGGRCASVTCAGGEICCPSTGECHAPSCTDCCPPVVPLPDLPTWVGPGEEPEPPMPGGAAEVPPPTMPTEGPGPGPDPPR